MTADELKRWRKRRRLTQRQLAEFLECSVRTLSGYETGERPMPRYFVAFIRTIEDIERRSDRDIWQVRERQQ